MTTYEQFAMDAEEHRTIPVVETFYTDILTPVHMFHALKEEAVYMLESKEPDSPWSNFSFIGLNPMVEIEGQHGSFIINDLEKEDKTAKNTLQEAFDHVVNVLDVSIPEIDIPFRGGAVGYISYDSISDYEPVPEPADEGGSLPDYHLLFCRTLLAYNHRSQEVTVLTFAQTDAEIGLAAKYADSKRIIADIRRRLAGQIALTDLMLPGDLEADREIKFKSNYVKEKFKNDVLKIKAYIEAGDILQAVLSQRFETRTDRNGFELYRVLRHVNPSPYMYYLKFDGVEVIGSSPERLLQVQDNRLEAHPIAGTRKRGATQAEDDRLAEELLNDEKEISEHRMLVDLARNDIGRVSEFGTVEVSEYMVIGRFSKVMHIISKVNGTLRDDVSPIDAFISSFPAGTLSGAPKVRAMQILRELEPTPRNLYGGSILYLGFDGNVDSCITIRTMTLSEGSLYIQAGAGVVADSDPESEYQETVNKASALENTVRITETIFGAEAAGEPAKGGQR